MKPVKTLLKKTTKRNVIALNLIFLMIACASGCGDEVWTVEKEEEISSITFSPDQPTRSFRVNFTANQSALSGGDITGNIVLDVSADPPNLDINSSRVDFMLYFAGDLNVPVDSDSFYFLDSDPDNDHSQRWNEFHLSSNSYNVWNNCPKTGDCTISYVITGNFIGEDSIGAKISLQAHVNTTSEEKPPSDSSIAITFEEIE